MWSKKWWWVGIAVLAIACVIGWKGKQCQTQAGQCRSQYATELSSIGPNHKASEQQAIAAACEPNGYSCRLVSPAILPTALLVFVGIAGICVAIRTLEATSKSIKVFADKEKARVRVEIKPLVLRNPNGMTYNESDMRPGEWDARRHVAFEVKNCGPTAAFIVNSGCAAYYDREKLVESGVEIESKVMPPIGSLPREIPPNTGRIEACSPLSFGEHPNVVLSKIESGQLFVGVRGFISYRDVFDEERRTTFRYIWRLRNTGGVRAMPGGGSKDLSDGNWMLCGGRGENQET